MTDENKLHLADAEKPMQTEIAGIPVLALPPGWNAKNYEHFMDSPKHITESIKMVSLKSFIEYVNRYKHDKNSIIKLIMPDAHTIKAQANLDYHPPGPGKPAAWCCHSAWFMPKKTNSWSIWTENNGRAMRQADFCDFIYENMVDIKNPDGAALLEIVKTLKATTKGEFKDYRDLHTGSIELIFNMKVSAAGGSTASPVSLPEKITVVLQPFHGSHFFEVTADLMIIAPKRDGEPLHLGFKFYRFGDLFETVAADVEQHLAKETKLPVFRTRQ